MQKRKYMVCSAVVTVYSGTNPGYFTEALESVLGQTQKSDDIIIIADGAIDNNLDKLINEYTNRYKHITFEKLPKNAGAAAARNHGASLAKNELIAIIDDDDISLPERFSKQIAEFNRDESLTGVGGQLAEFENNDPKKLTSIRKVPTEHSEIYQFSKRRSPINDPTMMWQKTVFIKHGGYPEGWRRGMDYALVMSLLVQGHKIANLEDIVLHYRIDSDNLKRRGAKLGQKIALQKYFLQNGYISTKDFTATSAGLVAMKIVPPAVKKMLYKRFLRGVTK